MYPSSVSAIKPARSENTPPAEANRYGMAMRSVCARKANMRQEAGGGSSKGSDLGVGSRRRGGDGLLAPAYRLVPQLNQRASHFRHGGRHRDDDHGLEHIDHLLRHERVDR